MQTNRGFRKVIVVATALAVLGSDAAVLTTPAFAQSGGYAPAFSNGHAPASGGVPGMPSLGGSVPIFPSSPAAPMAPAVTRSILRAPSGCTVPAQVVTPAPQTVSVPRTRAPQGALEAAAAGFPGAGGGAVTNIAMNQAPPMLVPGQAAIPFQQGPVAGQGPARPGDPQALPADLHRQAAEPEPPSRIEAAFQVLPFSLGHVPALQQYGYAMFASPVSTFAPVDDIPVGPDYVLGPGDDLTINVWGPVDSTVVRTVDRNGRILLPKIGDLRVWGLTFSQADQLIRDQLSRYFKGFQTSVTMGRLRTVTVHVVGEVCQPGVYTLSSLSTVTNALFSAGGPTKLGSLREVRVLRNSHQVGILDLYDFLQRGDRTRDFRLESGDTVFVPTIGDVAAITGEVKRPAIYEIRGEVRVSDLVKMAGGVTPGSYLRRIQVVRAQPSAERVTEDVDLGRFYARGDAGDNPRLNAGDMVLIHRSDPRIYNVVTVQGAVKYPGAYELKPSLRISQLLPPDKLLREAYPDRVEIARRNDDLTLEILSVDLRKAWRGDLQQDIALESLDEVTVRTEERAKRMVTLTGQVVRPGQYTIAQGEKLSSVLERAGGFTEKAYLKSAVYIRDALKKTEQEQLDAFVRVQEQRILAAAAQPIVGAEKDEVLQEQAALQARRELLKALAARVTVGRMVVNLDEPARLRGTENDIVLVDGDSLFVPEPPASVLVVGAVRSSTSVLHKDGANLEYYVNRVGGYSREADKKEVHIVKADGSAISSFSKLRTLEPGDTIVVPPKDEERIRTTTILRDFLQIGSSALISLAALAVLF